MPRVAVGLSGGVDSAVAALLLREAGHEVVGVHLYCWPPRSEYRGQRSEISEEEEKKLKSEWIKKNGCRADEDEQMALKTALELGIKFVKLDFSEEYNSRVVGYFYREYEAGRTPNPDVLCNSEIKFGLFLDWALENNFDYIATGHYAKLEAVATNLSKNGNVSESSDSEQPDSHPENPAGSGDQAFRDSENFLPGSSATSYDTIRLIIPKDKHKDQTYFLWKLTQKELKHVLFPLGDLLKSEVREIANKNNLSVANRKDSQGICFIGNVEAREFLARRLKKQVGEVKNTAGEVIGEHDGVWFYTIGQRGGWRLSAKSQKLENSLLRSRATEGQAKNQMGDVTPIYYVISKNAERNELVVGIDSEAKEGVFEISEVNGEFEGKMYVRIRHTGELIPCMVSDKKVEMEEAQKGVAPGQSAVFYSATGEVLGGGVIV